MITHPHTHGTPLAEMAVDDFMAPVQTAARTTFLTARAAARHMIPQRSGVILAFGGPGDRSGPMRDYYLGGTQVAFDAIETMRRQLSAEFGPHGIRVVTLASGGVPESLPEGLEGREAIAEDDRGPDAARSGRDARGRRQRRRLRRLGLGAQRDRRPPSTSAAARWSTDRGESSRAPGLVVGVEPVADLDALAAALRERLLTRVGARGPGDVEGRIRALVEREAALLDAGAREALWRGWPSARSGSGRSSRCCATPRSTR